MFKDLDIKIYSDGADITEIREIVKNDYVSGVTTNPSLLKKAGVEDYLQFAKDTVAEFPDMDISFEVFSNDSETMLEEAKILHDLGSHVFVKVPIINTKGEPTTDVIKKLSEAKVNLNITAITTIEQVKMAVDAFSEGTKNIVSIFVGRLADVGINPAEFIKQSVEVVKANDTAELLWASTREVFNIYEAAANGVDIITVPPAIINKLKKVGTTAEEVSLDTVKGFEKDIKASGLSIL